MTARAPECVPWRHHWQKLQRRCFFGLAVTYWRCRRCLKTVDRDPAPRGIPARVEPRLR